MRTLVQYIVYHYGIYFICVIDGHDDVFLEENYVSSSSESSDEEREVKEQTNDYSRSDIRPVRTVTVGQVRFFIFGPIGGSPKGRNVLFMFNDIK